MPHITTLPWIDPLHLAGQVDCAYEDCVFLYSGLDAGYSGGRSILAYDKKGEVKGSDLAALQVKLSADAEPFDHAWFGYLGYGLKNQLEDLPEDLPGSVPMPDSWMVNFGYVLVFDHRQKYIEVWGNVDALAWDAKLSEAEPELSSNVSIAGLSSNMTADEYLSHVEAIRQHILAGDVYQANLTRKFYGEFAHNPNGFELFYALTKVSPAPVLNIAI